MGLALRVKGFRAVAAAPQVHFNGAHGLPQ